MSDETRQELGIDADGHIISTGEFTTPPVMTVHSDGTETEPDYDVYAAALDTTEAPAVTTKVLSAPIEDKSAS